MTDPIQAFLQSASMAPAAFPPGSRYHGLPTAIWIRPDGRQVPYATRRFVPPPERFDEIGHHVVVEGDRVDNLAAAHLGDAQQWWRLCDANGVLRPAELTDTPGRRLRITLPEGIPGAPDA